MGKRQQAEACSAKVGMCEILLVEFLELMGISQYRLAKEIAVPQRRIGEIVAGTRGATVDTGLRLSRFFGMSDGFWIGLQLDYDAAMTKEELFHDLLPWLERIVPIIQTKCALH